MAGATGGALSPWQATLAGKQLANFGVTAAAANAPAAGPATPNAVAVPESWPTAQELKQLTVAPPIVQSPPVSAVVNPPG